LGAYKVKGSGGLPQYEAGSDGKCFNIRQGVRGLIRFGRFLLLIGSVNHHRQRGSDCTVLTATGLVNEEWQISTQYRIETTKPIDTKVGTGDYVGETTPYANRSTGGFCANR